MIILPVSMAQAKEESDVFFIELYRCHLPTGTFYIAACDEEIVFNGITFQPLPIQRGDITSTVDNKIDNVEIKIANVTQEFTTALYQGLDFRGSLVEIATILYPNSLTDSNIYRWTFVGTIDSPYFDGKEFRATLKAQVPNMMVPTRKHQLSCNAWFGDPDECGATKIKVSGTMLSNSTQHVIRDNSINEGVNYWKDGIAEYNGEKRKIAKSESGNITLEYPFTYAVQGGAVYTRENGCDKTAVTCKNRHNNRQNYSGFLSIPFELVVRT